MKFITLVLCGLLASSLSFGQSVEELDQLFKSENKTQALKQIMTDFKRITRENYGAEVANDLTTIVKAKDGSIKYIKGMNYVCSANAIGGLYYPVQCLPLN